MKLKILIAIISLISNFGFAQTQLEMNEEANQNYIKADKELNSTYKKILNEYKSEIEFIKNLKISQNIWIKFRDAEMNMKFPEKQPGYYGSYHPVCWSKYLTKLTQKRTEELKIWLIGIEEGDLCTGSVKMKN
jgi:uncharacterized protein YecT (DUF1311 family)